MVCVRSDRINVLAVFLVDAIEIREGQTENPVLLIADVNAVLDEMQIQTMIGNIPQRQIPGELAARDDGLLVLRRRFRGAASGGVSPGIAPV